MAPVIKTTYYQCTFNDDAPHGYFLCYEAEFERGEKDRDYIKPRKWCPVFWKNCTSCEFFTHINKEVEVDWNLW